MVLTVAYLQSILKPVSSSQIFLQLLEYSTASELLKQTEIPNWISSKMKA